MTGDRAPSDFELGAPIVTGVALREDDGAALALAAELAAAIGAPLALVHAYPYQPLIAIPPPAWEQEMRDEVLTELDRLAAPLGASVYATPSPSPVRALHEAAEHVGASVIVAGSSHRGTTRRVVPGGVGERLLHAAPCAVAIAPRGYVRPPAGLRRIGVAYAAGPEGAQALALASALAARVGAKVRTYTVREPDGDGTLEGILAGARAAVPPELLEDTVVLEGDAAARLADVTGELDLMICGSRGYGPVRTLLLGGVSGTLAHTAACPLLVVPRPAEG